MSAKLFRVGCHVWDQLACSLRCLIYQCPSTCSINDTTVSRHQSFIEILNEQLIGYLMMKALNAQLLKSFPILGKCLSIRLSNPTYFFPYVGNSRCWEILFKENLLHGIPSSNGTWENREKPCLCYPFQRERKSFQLNLFFINSIRFHANTNHMELFEMSMRIFSYNTIECW